MPTTVGIHVVSRRLVPSIIGAQIMINSVVNFLILLICIELITYY